MQLRVLKQHRFAGVRYSPGDTYEATGRNARILVAAKLSVEAGSIPASEDSGREYGRRDLTAEQGRQKRKYTRRDMKAEG